MGTFQDISREHTAESGQARMSGQNRRAKSGSRRAIRRSRRALALALALVLGTLPAILTPFPLIAEDPVARSQLRTGLELQVRVRENRAPSPTESVLTVKPLRASVTPDPPPLRSPTPGADSPEADRSATKPAPLGKNDDEYEGTTPGSPPAELREQTAPSEVPSEVFPSQFQEVVPGTTTRDQLRTQFGEPVQQLTGEKNVIWAYQVGPFPRVEFRLERDIVQAIRIQLAEPMNRKKVVADLDLGDFETTPMADDQGEVRGEIVPERGLQLTWSRAGDPPEVTQILLEVPRGSHFVRRAQQDPSQRYQRMLSDLSVAKRLGPQSAEGLALEARIRQRLGQPAAALELASNAVLQDDQSPSYRLLKARLLSANGRHAEARQLVDQVLADKRVAAELLAYAACVRGELLLASPTGRPEQALENFQRAIATAGKLANAEANPTPRTAQEVLLVSYLGGASAIAQGKWQNRAVTVEKWWNSAREISLELYDGEQDGSLERWDLRRRHLHLASLAGGRIPVQEIDALRIDAKRLSDRAGDELLTNRLDWELAEALLYAAELAQANGLWPEAREYAEEGMQRAKSAAASREPGFETDYLQGRLAFLLGAYHAVVSKDTDQVKQWLDQAARRFANQQSLPAVEQVRQGERLVFLGQAYADQGDRDAAIRWLARAVDLLEPLAQKGFIPKQRATAPLEQLAALHRAQGKKESAAELSARAASLAKGSTAAK